MEIDVTLTNSGFLLPGAGEGSALIDADPVVTADGFPYIPARTFKGLFKETLLEVLEIQGKHAEADAICAKLFGLPGGKQDALLRFDNLYLDDFANARTLLPAYRKKYPRAMDPGRVTAHYTWEVAQTAIAADGVAKDRSLRNFRAIRPGKTFRGKIGFDDVEVLNHRDLLNQTASHLRYAGIKRNRGFGKVMVKLGVPTKMEAPDPGNNSHSNTGKLEALQITLTTTSSTVLSAITGDQNTVSSDAYVRGSRVRGLIAEQLVRSLALGTEAHKNELFWEAVLSGKVHFRPAYPANALPVPLNVHKIKGRADEDLLDMFHDELLKDENGQVRNIRTVGGLGRIENKQLLKTKTAICAHFHNSRPNRSAGRNMEHDEEGGIFYYEGVEAGQSFSGFITGDPDILGKLYAELPPEWEMRLGKSKSTQYGDVSIRIGRVEKVEQVPDLQGTKEVLLHFRSPVAFYNSNGFPACNQEALLDYLRDFGIQAKLIKSAANVVLAEYWNQQWNSRSGQFPVYQEGSVFLLQVLQSDQAAWENLVRDGLGELGEQGYGWVTVQAWSDFPDRIAMLDPDEETTSGEATGSTVLDELVESFAQNQKENEIRLLALDATLKNPILIPNHLLSRLDQKLSVLVAGQGNTMNMVTAFRKWLDELKDRPAGDTLKKKKLFEPLHDFFDYLPARVRPDEASQKKLDPKAEQEVIKLAVIAWKAVFKTIRNLNKKGKPNGN